MRKWIIGFAAAALCMGQSAMALPQMDITQAKSTLTNRQNNPTGAKFNRLRVRDQPSFDKLGIGNYFAEYALNDKQKLQVWMYVESAPPLVDEVVVYIYPANPSDVSYARALKLLKVVYDDSRPGAKVVTDFQDAHNMAVKNQYNADTKHYEDGSLLPRSYDGGLYYLGKNFGYKVHHHKGGLEVGIYRKDYWQKLIMDVKKRRFPDPKPTPKPVVKPVPKSTPNPTIVW